MRGPLLPDIPVGFRRATQSCCPGEKNVGEIIAWLLNSFLNDQYSSVASAHHGDSARSTGPRRFLVQLRVLQLSEPRLGAPPLAVDPPARARADPAVGVRRLKQIIAEKWPDGGPRHFRRGCEAIRFQAMLINVLARSLAQASDCACRNLARNVTAAQVFSSSSSFWEGVPMSALAAVGPDRTSGFARLPKGPTAAALQGHLVLEPNLFNRSVISARSRSISAPGYYCRSSSFICFT
ncbi:unnamed protein product [Prorocentrum cordatum]|uniref:Uncharacterized protein n=1 Tax=Prorocentrum cordatum TaxID=2364126 RepID=A0ABN9W713_9DINO|nr:unnamed protein product [Polarella glacialis]